MHDFQKPSCHANLGSQVSRPSVDRFSIFQRQSTQNDFMCEEKLITQRVDEQNEFIFPKHISKIEMHQLPDLAELRSRHSIFLILSYSRERAPTPRAGWALLASGRTARPFVKTNKREQVFRSECLGACNSKALERMSGPRSSAIAFSLRRSATKSARLARLKNSIHFA